MKKQALRACFFIFPQNISACFRQKGQKTFRKPLFHLMKNAIFYTIIYFCIKSRTQKKIIRHFDAKR